VAIDGKPITKMDDLLIYLERYTSPDQSVQLSVVRSDGSTTELTLKLGERPQQQGES
jgi:S1-C subfamily serine protease